VRDNAPSSYPQSTGRFDEPPPSPFERDLLAERLAAVVGGAALVSFVARERSWRALGAAVAGVPLIYRGATGSWPVPRAVTRKVRSAAQAGPLQVETSLVIAKPATELYAFWRDLENLPRFMKNLDEVHEIGDRRSRWVGRTPLGAKAGWEAEIVDEQPGRLISWQSVEDSLVETAGSVVLEEAPAGRGTIVRVSLEVRPPGLLVGQALARFSRPLLEMEVREDLRRFKSLMEAGEVPTTAGQPAGARSAINPKNPF
jgi:uncharacterized membrane protein